MSRTFDLYDNSWIAVKGAEVEFILELMSLSDPTPATWQEGLDAVMRDFWETTPLDSQPAQYSRVFITPPVDGWRLIVGGWVCLGAFVPESFEAGSTTGTLLDLVRNYCSTLSGQYGSAHAFTTQMRMGWYGWLLCTNGAVDRAFVYEDRVVLNQGEWTEAERRMRGLPLDDPEEPWEDQVFGEDAVMELAAEVSISPPIFLEGVNSNDQGVLALTSWGRRYGVPRNTTHH